MITRKEVCLRAKSGQSLNSLKSTIESNPRFME